MAAPARNNAAQGGRDPRASASPASGSSCQSARPHRAYLRGRKVPPAARGATPAPGRCTAALQQDMALPALRIRDGAADADAASRNRAWRSVSFPDLAARSAAFLRSIQPQ